MPGENVEPKDLMKAGGVAEKVGLSGGSKKNTVKGPQKKQQRGTQSRRQQRNKQQRGTQSRRQQRNKQQRNKQQSRRQQSRRQRGGYNVPTSAVV